MGKYNVKIIETLATTETVEADNADDAEEIIRKKYENCEIILSVENYVETNIIVTGSSEKLIDCQCVCGSSGFLIEESC